VSILECGNDGCGEKAPREISDGTHPTAHSTSDETSSHEGQEN